MVDPVTLALLLAGAAGAWFFFFHKRPLRSPDAVGEQLRRLGDEYSVVSGLVRMREEGMDRIDHAVISPYGVFIILEVKEPGTLECRMNAMDWPRKGPGPASTVHNPVWRNKKRINSLEKEFPGIPMVNLVVIVNARLVGNPGPEVVPFDGLINRIRKNRITVLEREQVEEVGGRFEKL